MAPENDSSRRDRKRGKRIKDVRLREGLTQEDLAAKLDSRRMHPTRADVAEWESGGPVTLRVLSALAAVLGESQRFLGTGDEDSGVRIARRRAQRELSQEQLAARLGISARKLQYWEAGKVPDAREQLDELARELDASVEYILTGEPVPERATPAGDQRDEDRRMSGGFHDLAHLIASAQTGVQGEDPKATLTALRKDVQALATQVQALNQSVRELRRDQRARDQLGTGGSQQEGSGEQQNPG